jgi:hypothetical protein
MSQLQGNQHGLNATHGDLQELFQSMQAERARMLEDNARLLATIQRLEHVEVSRAQQCVYSLVVFYVELTDCQSSRFPVSHH